MDLLSTEPELRHDVKGYLEQLLTEAWYRYTFAELGILGKETFGQAMRDRLFQRMLPPTAEDKTVREMLNML
ncbi:MAG: site-specific recombinase, partial [Limnobacter sp.]|nr:site-specific recombinase [Limnobacter sp.]